MTHEEFKTLIQQEDSKTRLEKAKSIMAEIDFAKDLLKRHFTKGICLLAKPEVEVTIKVTKKVCDKVNERCGNETSGRKIDDAVKTKALINAYIKCLQTEFEKI